MAVFGGPGSFVPKYRFKLSDLSYHGNKVISCDSARNPLAVSLSCHEIYTFFILTRQPSREKSEIRVPKLGK